MGLRDTWSRVPFELVLNYDVPGDHYSSRHDAAMMEFSQCAEEVISQHFPQIDLGATGLGLPHPIRWAKTDLSTFREHFGDLGRGITLLYIGFSPCDLYTTWYRKGDLFVPEELQEVVKDVRLSRPATGSFGELHLWKPFGVVD